MKLNLTQTYFLMAAATPQGASSRAYSSQTIRKFVKLGWVFPEVVRFVVGAGQQVRFGVVYRLTDKGRQECEKLNRGKAA